MTLQDLYEQHRDVMRLGAELVELTLIDPVPMSELMAVRRALSQAMSHHLLLEARIALTPMTASGDPADRALARRYTSDLLLMRQASSPHMAYWTPLAIAADPREYRLATRTLLKMVAARRDWEESEFLPAAERLLARQPELRKAG